MSTDELIRRVTKIEDEREIERKKRHEANNALGKSLLRMSDDIMQHDETLQNLPKFLKMVTAHDYLLIGVDGENGLRGDMKKVMAFQQQTNDYLIGLKAKMGFTASIFGIVFGVVGTIVAQLFLHLIKIG